MSSYANAGRWAPKYVGFFAASAFFLLVIFNKSEWKIRFLDWGAGGLIVALMFLFFLSRARISKKEFTVITLPLLWVSYAALLTPFAHDMPHHLAELGQVMFLNTIACFTVISVFSRERLMNRVLVLTVTCWIGISLLLLVLWHSGLVQYEKKDFAGLFRNRNEFAVQTAILLGMFFLLVRGKFFFKATLAGIGFMLIFSTLSVKGFLFLFFIIFFPIFIKSSVQKKFFVLVLGFFMLSIFCVSMPNMQERLKRFSMVVTNPEDLRVTESAFLRTWLIVEGGKIIASNPMTGVGVDNARFLLIPPLAQERGEEEGLYSHNNYIEMGLNAGVIGLLLFYFPLFYVYFKVNKAHLFFVAIRSYVALYLLMGIGMVQYNSFICILLYCLIIFLYFYHSQGAGFEKNTLYRQHA